MLGIITIKIVVLLLMLVITFIASMLPLLFVRSIRRTADADRRSKYHDILGLLSCIAGGVFMGTCILDLFPDTQMQIDKVLSAYPPSVRAFPVAEFIVVFGFLFVLTVEQIVLWFKELHLEAHPPLAASLPAAVDPASVARRSIQREHSLGGVSDRPDLTASIHSNGSFVVNYGAVGNNGYRTIVDDDVVFSDNSPLGATAALDGVVLHSTLRSVMLLMALSLHSVFEGLAVGLQETIDDVVSLFVIVIIHKGIIAFSLGLNMVQSRLAVSQVFISNIIFCITAPLGVALGVGITSMQESPTVALAAGCLQGIACGTFLYVTFFEVLPHELNSGHLRLWKNICVILGFVAVCGMMFIEPSQKTPKDDFFA